MKKICNSFISVFFSFLFAIYPLLYGCRNVFAAQSDNTTGVSKGVTAFIMITVFIATAVITAFITFKMRKNKINNSANVPSDDGNEK